MGAVTEMQRHTRSRLTEEAHALALDEAIRVMLQHSRPGKFRRLFGDRFIVGGRELRAVLILRTMSRPSA